ncbi:MAG: ROK family protein [Solirubrobacterales bacterium]|nr:ROK family protein [Solirubrobacterales bacterium]
MADVCVVGVDLGGTKLLAGSLDGELNVRNRAHRWVSQLSASGVPVFVDNDGNAAVLAEARSGSAQGARDVVMLTIGTGIGGGLFLNGGVYRGSVGCAADLGHIVIEMDGPPCLGSCRGRGCLEVYVSGPALAKEGERMASLSPQSGLAGAIADGELVSCCWLQLVRWLLPERWHWRAMSFALFRPDSELKRGWSVLASWQLNELDL